VSGPLLKDGRVPLFREETGTGPLVDPKELLDMLDPDPPTELDGAGMLELLSGAATVEELE